jgi:hypothetical protein
LSPKPVSGYRSHLFGGELLIRELAIAITFLDSILKMLKCNGTENFPPLGSISDRSIASIRFRDTVERSNVNISPYVRRGSKKSIIQANQAIQ